MYLFYQICLALNGSCSLDNIMIFVIKQQKKVAYFNFGVDKDRAVFYTKPRKSDEKKSK